MPEYGSPMLSRIVCIFAFGICLCESASSISIAQPRRLFDASTGLRTHMQLELTAVDLREEVLAQPKKSSANESRQKSMKQVVNRPRCASVVSSSDRGIRGATSQSRAQRRAENAREELRLALASSMLVALSRCTSPSSAQWCAKASTRPASRRPPPPPAAQKDIRHAGQEEHRHKHDADAQRRDERRHRDLRRAIQNGLFDLLALFQIAVDVFDLYRRVVHQDAHRQRQPAQRHDVDRLAAARSA